MNFIANIKKLRHRFYLWMYHRYPIQNNKIITWNGLFRGYGDNTKYIVEYLCKNQPGKYDIVWVYEREKGAPTGLPSEVRAIPYFSISYLKEISTAKIIISNIRTGEMHYFRKRKGQFYLQTWHSSVRLKKIERDAEDALGAGYVERAKEDAAKCDLIVSGCDFSTGIFSNSFWYNGPVLKSGTPRCDIFFSMSDKLKERICENIGVESSVNIALYAPTFRDNCADELHEIPVVRLLDALKKRYGGEWVFLYRLHPNLDKPIPSACDLAIDVSKYPDMQELIAASELLITDYSSCMFDMALCRKKCCLYVPDLQDYVEKERGLYFEIDSLPFPLSHNPDELIDTIINFDYESYQIKLDAFATKIGSYEDGNACKRIADKIGEICCGRKDVQ